MPHIQVLDKHVAELIAAGEVVERPASVIKELVENSIDAGATQITVEIQNGGVTYMRVTDNGCGIARDDVPTAFLRHATSKVASETDLEKIGTLGFRGEALASVAAVARVEMMTCCENGVGVLYRIHGGEEVSFDDAGCPVGTTIIVRDLFYNTPARMKFLKKDVGEANAVAGVLDRIALSHPEISLRFIRDGKVTLSTQGNGELRDTVYAVFGREFANSLIAVDYSNESMSIRGFVGSPVSARANRNMQHFFINGRCVKSKNLIAALEQACKGSIMVGKFPTCVLNLIVPFNQVDINVSPSKTEARFVNEREVFNVVYYGIKTALSHGDTRPELKLDTPVAKKNSGEQISINNTLGASAQKQSVNLFDAVISSDKTVAKSDAKPDLGANKLPVGYSPLVSAPQKDGMHLAFRSQPLVNYRTESHRPDLDVICDDEPQSNFFAATVSPTTAPASEIAPQPKTTVSYEDESPTETAFKSAKTVFAHAAPEAALDVAPDTAPVRHDTESVDRTAADTDDIRVIGELFTTYIIAEHGDSVVFIDKHAAHERMLYEQIKRDEHDGQILLEPVTVQLSKDEYTFITDNLDMIAHVGFDIEDFGASSVIVRAVPTLLAGENVADLILEIAGGFCENKQSVEIEKLDWLYHNIACRAAIKAGSRSNAAEMTALAERIIGQDDIRYCPHGRPVAFVLTKKELEKRFGRLG